MGGGNFLPGLGSGFANNSNLLMGLGAGLWSGGLGRGLQDALAGGALDQKQRAAKLQQQSTYAALKARGISDADATAAALNPEMLRMIIRSKTRQELLRLARTASGPSSTGNERSSRRASGCPHPIESDKLGLCRLCPNCHGEMVPGRKKPCARSCFVHCSEDNPFRKLALVHSVVHRASVKLGAWFDRQPRTYAVSIRSSVGPLSGSAGGPCQKMTDDVHNPAVNWYSFHNRDGLVRRRMRFARM